MTNMRKFINRNKTTFAITTLMLPGALWLLLIRYIPMAGIVIAFQDYRPHPPNPTLLNNIINSRWVGFDNFRFMFASADAWRMIRNTLAYNAVFIVLTMVFAVAFAIMLNELTKKFMAKLYQTLMFFPFVISWVVVSYFVFAFLAPTYGLLAENTNWYMDSTLWPLILTSANLWKTVGYSCIMYLVAITSIDTTQYEAASIDGATKWQQVWNVTIPHIKPMIVILLILSAGRIFNADFGLFYNVTLDSGPLYPVTDVVDTYVFRALQRLNNIGMSTAAGLFQNVVGFICIMLVNGIVRKLEPDHALF
ncbi:MAG: ABC transporter permease subunit [Defluviitaleaceae bacterium]|nr:ABC transporter permease subunit [Defluviitaleaceae bacterium]